MSAAAFLLSIFLAAIGEECETCHPGATRDVASTVHRGLENRCTGCHGGDPASFDERRAHEGDFREKPFTDCAACHETEAEAFGAGPHALATRTAAMRGCVECHGFHELPEPTHALLEDACARCHAADSPEIVEAGAATARALRALDGVLERAAATIEDLDAAGVPTRRERETLEGLRLRLLEVLPRQHEMDLDAFALSVAGLREESEAFAAGGGETLAGVRARRWWILPVLGIAALNALAIGLKRRSLRRIES